MTRGRCEYGRQHAAASADLVNLPLAVYCQEPEHYNGAGWSLGFLICRGVQRSKERSRRGCWPS